MKAKMAFISLVLFSASHAVFASEVSSNNPTNNPDEQWRKKLSPEQFCIMRQKGTERPFHNKYDSFFKPGVYECAACGAKLFDSSTKYDSKTGWPAFFKPVSKDSIRMESDNSFGMQRSEVLCAKCGSHLGHEFDDGPAPTGQHYCINSAALNFIPATVDPAKKP